MTDSVFEVAVYTVQEEKIPEFLEKLEFAHAAMKSMPGFVSLQSVRCIEEQNRFVDYCQWQSYNHAVQAQQRAMEMPEFKIFFELGSGMISFGQYQSIRKTEAKVA